jgi:transcriptional regulator with XRE-family HTH domain
VSRGSSSWSDFTQELGIRLHRRRVELGLTQEALAQSAGITRNYYRRMERGLAAARDEAANPSLKVILRLCVELDTSLEELLPEYSKLRWD